MTKKLPWCTLRSGSEVQEGKVKGNNKGGELRSGDHQGNVQLVAEAGDRACPRGSLPALDHNLGQGVIRIGWKQCLQCSLTAGL